MNRVHLGPSYSDLESVFAVERVLVPVPEEVRHRVIERARASLRLVSPEERVVRISGPRRLSFGLAAAAAVILSALCAAAYFAGHRIKIGGTEGSKGLPFAPLVTQLAPSSMPLVPVAPAGSSTNNTEADIGSSRQSKPNSIGATKSASDIETYAKELRVLQPARQAVAQQDFTAALSAIEEHQRQFPSGKLTEEREALRVKALLGLGRTAEAQRVATAFRAHFPRSALLKRIDEMLGTRR